MKIATPIYTKLAAFTFILLLNNVAFGKPIPVLESLSEQELNQFITEYRVNPATPSKYPDYLQRATPEQIRSVIESLDVTAFTYMWPAIIPGDHLETIHGEKLENLSVMAMRGDKLIPIPFQFDEFDETGLVYIEGVTYHRPAGNLNELDGNDELMFMYRDANFAQYKPGITSLNEGQVIKEIKLADQGQQTRYAYIVKNNSARSDADYVSIDIEEGRMETTLLKVLYNPDNIIELQHTSPKVGPGFGKNVLDSLYVKVHTGIFFESFRVGLDTKKNIVAKPKGVADGPIRASSLVDINIYYFDIPVIRLQFNLTLYEQALKFRSRFSGDALNLAKYVTLILKDPGLYVAVDFDDMTGSTAAMASISPYITNPQDWPKVDGKMSPMEKLITKKRLPGDWLWLDTHQGYNFFLANLLPLAEEGLFDAFLEGMEWQIIYVDNYKDRTKFERFPGASPRIGVEGHGLPPIALEAMSAIANIDFGQLETIDDMIETIINLDKQGEFDKIDSIVQDKLVELKKTGKFKNNEELARAFIADFNLVGIRGINRDQLNDLIWQTCLRLPEDWGQFKWAPTLANFRAIANEKQYDLSKIKYAPRDNTLWFPDTVHTAGGPNEFFHQVNNPPEIILNDIGPLVSSQ